ncbi:MAG: cob(I)yrinic acid a,c-diamide adenosyltransferase [Alphaproteobacteria bacterium]|nr:cob(I)yrinic acid a,c-diamide adenosyltransferase [Alphaproteobacteria bacterium]
MVKLNKIYTRTGDKGQTGLGDGSRVAKHSIRVAAYGTVDEAGAVIGLARAEAENAGNAGPPDIGTSAEMLARIQNDLFDLGADLCTPERKDPKYPPLRISAQQVARLEDEIDAMNQALKPLDTFVLAGGSALSSWLHLGRTVVRRAERLIVELAGEESINPQAITYANRLSDHLFVMARYYNDKGKADVLWVPGKNR